MSTKTPTKQPPRPKCQHGGSRPGAGRKPRKGPDTPAASAIEYLRMVAVGEVEGDSLRVAAAKSLLAYENPRTRAPMKGLSPSAARQSAAAAVEDDQSIQWERTAARIRNKHKKVTP